MFTEYPLIGKGRLTSILASYAVTAALRVGFFLEKPLNLGGRKSAQMF
jgi:hypothetical protein